MSRKADILTRITFIDTGRLEFTSLYVMGRTFLHMVFQMVA